MAQTVKHLPTMWEAWVWSLGWEDPLEKEMATYSSTIAWKKILWTEQPCRLQSMGLQRVGQDWATLYVCMYMYVFLNKTFNITIAETWKWFWIFILLMLFLFWLLKFVPLVFPGKLSYMQTNIILSLFFQCIFIFLSYLISRIKPTKLFLLWKVIMVILV